MSPRPTLARCWSAAAVAATAVTLGTFGAGLGDADRLVEASFASALRSGAAADPSASAPSAPQSGLAQLSGSEEFWLKSAAPAPGTLPVAWSKPLGVGDRVTISSNGRERQLEVVEISPIGDRATAGAGATADRSSLLLVTCRETGVPDARPVRFVIERDEGPGHVAGRDPHAL